jgi:hypothetical protein
MLRTMHCSSVGGDMQQLVKVFCRQERPPQEQEGTSDHHYAHQKNAMELIKTFEDIIEKEDDSRNFVRSITDDGNAVLEDQDSDANANLNKEKEHTTKEPVLDKEKEIQVATAHPTDCGCIEKSTLAKLTADNSTSLDTTSVGSKSQERRLVNI